ncbi:MAG: hypothetical protein HXY52_03325 [Nitrospirae bacterium]|nr:hypothetical protein [Nitrospirota bacterium]
MKSKLGIFIITTLFLIFIFTYSNTCFAANSLNFNETFQQRGDCFILWGIPFCDGGAINGKFTINSKISLSGIDINKFDRETKFIFEIGGLSFETKLGSDWKYSPGKTAFNISYVDRLEESYKPVKYITINLKWNSKLLTVKITGITPDFISPIAADAYIGGVSGKFNDSTIGYFTLGDELYAGFNINYTATVSTKTVKSKNGNETVISKVTIKGIGTETSQDYRNIFQEKRALKKKFISSIYE